LPLVDWSIDLNHEAPGMAVEIGYVAVNDLLTPEVHSMESIRPEAFPKHLLFAS
jgi:hypothetical protein